MIKNFRSKLHKNGTFTQRLRRVSRAGHHIRQPLYISIVVNKIFFLARARARGARAARVAGRTSGSSGVAFNSRLTFEWMQSISVTVFFKHFGIGYQAVSFCAHLWINYGPKSAKFWRTEISSRGGQNLTPKFLCFLAFLQNYRFFLTPIFVKKSGFFDKFGGSKIIDFFAKNAKKTQKIAIFGQKIAFLGGPGGSNSGGTRRDLAIWP